jgi:hypothetical protein
MLTDPGVQVPDSKFSAAFDVDEKTKSVFMTRQDVSYIFDFDAPDQLLHNFQREVDRVPLISQLTGLSQPDSVIVADFLGIVYEPNPVQYAPTIKPVKKVFLDGYDTQQAISLSASDPDVVLDQDGQPWICWVWRWRNDSYVHAISRRKISKADEKAEHQWEEVEIKGKVYDKPKTHVFRGFNKVHPSTSPLDIELDRKTWKAGQGLLTDGARRVVFKLDHCTGLFEINNAHWFATTNSNRQLVLTKYEFKTNQDNRRRLCDLGLACEFAGADAHGRLWFIVHSHTYDRELVGQQSCDWDTNTIQYIEPATSDTATQVTGTVVRHIPKTYHCYHSRISRDAKRLYAYCDRFWNNYLIRFQETKLGKGGQHPLTVWSL